METNYKFGAVFKLADSVESSADKVKFQRIFENTNGGVVLLGFREGQALERHLAPAEVMVTVLEGEIEFTMNDTPHALKQGDFILIGAEVAHSVVAITDAKVMLVKVRSDK